MYTKPCVCSTAALTLTLVLGLVLYGCPTEVDDTAGSLPSTNGRFTLTGLDSHNGKYAFIREKSSSTDTFLFGMSDVAGTTMIKGVAITDGVAEIPLYLYDPADGSLSAFDKSGDFSNAIIVYVSAQEEFNEAEIIKIPARGIFYSVQFVDGAVTKKRTDGIGL
jgi:hypothetical protein